MTPGQATRSRCPSLEQLRDLARPELAMSDRSVLETHLVECALCRTEWIADRDRRLERAVEAAPVHTGGIPAEVRERILGLGGASVAGDETGAKPTPDWGTGARVLSGDARQPGTVGAPRVAWIAAAGLIALVLGVAAWRLPSAWTLDASLTEAPIRGTATDDELRLLGAWNESGGVRLEWSVPADASHQALRIVDRRGDVLLESSMSFIASGRASNEPGIQRFLLDTATRMRLEREAGGSTLFWSVIASLDDGTRLVSPPALLPPLQ